MPGGIIRVVAGVDLKESFLSVISLKHFQHLYYAILNLASPLPYSHSRRDTLCVGEIVCRNSILPTKGGWIGELF